MGSILLQASVRVDGRGRKLIRVHTKPIKVLSKRLDIPPTLTNTIQAMDTLDMARRMPMQANPATGAMGVAI